jgi:hypothetical protein
VCNLFLHFTTEHCKSLKIQLFLPNKPLKFYYFMESMEMPTKLGNVTSAAVPTILQTNHFSALAARFEKFMSVC